MGCGLKYSDNGIEMPVCIVRFGGMQDKDVSRISDEWHEVEQSG